MTDRTVAAVFEDRETAGHALHALHAAEFPGSAVSLLTNETRKGQLVPGEPKAVEEGTGVGAGVGALLGSMAMAATVPVAGGIFVGGPLGAVLVGAASGAVGGGTAGALAGLGVDQPRAKAFEDRLHQGGVGIAVETHTRDEAERAAELLASSGGELIITTNPKP
ncbi:MAG TPA: hypothetical protein RMG48_20005 [Myxococcales bacterium LLY-WYZ-16_1]|nr:hypothetical protein [Myxococcales bacterium LLY-WYZ-16_1]